MQLTQNKTVNFESYIPPASVTKNEIGKRRIPYLP